MGSYESGSLTRRAILGASVGAFAATAAQALGRPAPAAAANGDAVLAGSSNFESARTAIYLLGYDNTDQALLAYTYGTGTALSALSYGGAGAEFVSTGAGRHGGYGQSWARSTGLMGWSGSGTDTPPNPIPDTGVYGVSSLESTSKGVHGLSGPGIGVKGETTTETGVGGLFAAPPGGRALAVFGQAFFNQSGVAHVPAGKTYVDVTVAFGLADSAAIIATIQGVRPGVGVSSVRPHYPKPNKARIYLTKVASHHSRTRVAWFVFG